MPTVADLLNIATWLGLLVAVVVLARLLITVLRGLLEVRVDIQPFTGPESLKSELLGLHELVREEMHEFEVEGGGSGLSFVFAPDQKVDFSESIKAVPAGMSTALSAVATLASVVPTRTKKIQGTIVPESSRGLGVVVTLLGSSDRLISTVAIWEDDVVPASAATPTMTERCDRLSIAAAAWLAYRLLAETDAGNRAAMLTQDWLSYARFRIAARIQLAGDPGSAREGYAAALDIDPRNRGALFNLGVLDLHELRNRTAFARLDATVKEIELIDDIRRPNSDRLWYRARYNRAIAVLNNRGRRAAGLREELEDLIKDADKQIWQLGGNDALLANSREADQVRFLAQVRASAIAFYADIVGRVGPA